jgi:hypothetical protein
MVKAAGYTRLYGYIRPFGSQVFAEVPGGMGEAYAPDQHLYLTSLRQAGLG